jgi:hypothetical protein
MSQRVDRNFFDDAILARKCSRQSIRIWDAQRAIGILMALAVRRQRKPIVRNCFVKEIAG